jgi:predicted nuclease with TOPRIM domain
MDDTDSKLLKAVTEILKALTEIFSWYTDPSFPLKVLIKRHEEVTENYEETQTFLKQCRVVPPTCLQEKINEVFNQKTNLETQIKQLENRLAYFVWLKSLKDNIEQIVNKNAT